MKTSISVTRLFFTGLAILLIVGLGSCADPYYAYRGGYYKSMPPGQAKKYYGTKSARPFAPGQQKKQYRY